jgi:SAM-dependent methyltransferase
MTLKAAVQSWIYDDRAFERLDETDDRVFYEIDRMVAHLDAEALRWSSEIIGALITEDRPVILDLMASWDSHLPSEIEVDRVVGLGLNANELAVNAVLDERIVHDLNIEPKLPFDDASFDVVLCTVSVDYLTRPFAVVAEVARVLRPGGLFLCLFSNRYFPEKAVRIWREASEAERALIVQDYFASTPLLTETQVFSVQGRPRPENDRYAGLGIPSDPVFAVWAERLGGPDDRPPRRPPSLTEGVVPEAELNRRKARVGRTLRCPYCDHELKKWAVPQTPFTEWDEPFMYICFNDRCPYLLRGWQAMDRQGNGGFSYRLMYNPGNDRCTPIPVPSLGALRESIVDD